MGMGSLRVQTMVGIWGNPHGCKVRGWPRVDLAMGRGDMGTPLGTLGEPRHPVGLGTSPESAEGPSPGPPPEGWVLWGEQHRGGPSTAIGDGIRAGPLSPARLGGDSTRMGNGDPLQHAHP